MKYISLLIIIVIVVMTFWLSRETKDLSMDQMNRMNKRITDYMTQVLEEKHPDAVEIEFSKIYNVVIESGRKMEAHFRFSYKKPDEQGRLEKVYRKGSFIITSEDGKKWIAQIEKAGDVKVEFMVPFEITTNGKSAGKTKSKNEKKIDNNSEEDRKSQTENDNKNKNQTEDDDKNKNQTESNENKNKPDDVQSEDNDENKNKSDDIQSEDDKGV